MQFDIRLAHSYEELSAFEDIERVVWGLHDRDIVPASNLVAAVHAGGIAAGVYHNDVAIGFVYGFPSFQQNWSEPLGLHSHMLAILPAYRGHGLGQALKWYQRSWCLEQGYAWITWTYDPLQGKNAKLNLEHLGASTNIYRVNEYGAMGGILNAGLPSDRLLAVWDIRQDVVQQLSEGEKRTAFTGNTVSVLECDEWGAPSLPDLNQNAAFLRLEIPPNLTELLTEDPPLATSWRERSRQVFLHYFAQGYRATRFVAGAYILETTEASTTPG